MNEREVAQVLRLFAAAWPWAEFSEQTTEAWAIALAAENPAKAAEAAVQLVQSEERPPSVAKFREVRRSLATTVPDLPAIAEWSSSPEPDYPDLLDHLADNRAVLAGAVERVAEAKRLTPEEQAAAVEQARMAAVERRGGALVPCPYCRMGDGHGTRDCRAEREAELVHLAHLKAVARAERKLRAEEAEKAGTT